MVRRVLVTAVLIILLFACQISLFGNLDLTGPSPNLMMVVCVSFAMLRGSESGMLTGFFCGLLTDAFTTGPIGLYALLYMYTGYFSGRVYRKFYPENYMIPLGMIALTDTLFGVICYIVLFLTRSRYHLLFYLFRVIVPEALYTLIAALLVYPLVLWLNTWLEDVEQRSMRRFV